MSGKFLLCKFGFKPLQFFAAAQIKVLAMARAQRIKVYILCSILSICSGVLAGLYLHRFASTAIMEVYRGENVAAGTYDEDTMYYDVLCVCGQL